MGNNINYGIVGKETVVNVYKKIGGENISADFHI